MSKQSDAKMAQNYTLATNNCGNCVKRTFDMELPTWMRQINTAITEGRHSGTPYSDLHRMEKNQRCGIGGFAVKKSAACDKHELKAVA